MMNAAWGSITENLKQIEIVEQKTAEPFTTDRIQTGNGREYTIQQFVSRYFPSSYHVKKGPIFSLTEFSNEIDCVLLAPNHPLLTTPIREVIIAEGVHAAIELKPDISNLSDAKTTEIKRSLKQIQSVKKLKRKVTRIDFSSFEPRQQNTFFDKIPTFLFSFKSKPATEIIQFLYRQIEKDVYGFEDFPDCIVTLDNGILFYTPYAKECMFKSLLEDSYESFPDSLFLHFSLNKEETLALFLVALYSVHPPEILVTDFILKNYLGHFPNGFSFQVFSAPQSETETQVQLVKKMKSFNSKRPPAQ